MVPSLVPSHSFARIPWDAVTSRQTPVAELLARPDGPIRRPPGQQIVGYTDSTGRKHARGGFALVRGSDSLAFVVENSHGIAGPAFELSQREVSRLHVRRFSWWKTGLLIATPVVFGIVAYDLSRGWTWNQ